MKNKIAMAAATLSMSLAVSANAATGTAKAQMKVLTSINVVKSSDLLFKEAPAGAAAETVPADVAETPQNASFSISGEPNRAIVITLPADGAIVMKKGQGGTPDTEIAVSSFTSNSLSTLDVNGAGTLFVGATRAALTPTQESGDYESNFDINVVY